MNTITRADAGDLLRALEWLGGDQQRPASKIDFPVALRIAKLIRVLREIAKETEFARRTQLAVFTNGTAGISPADPRYMEAQGVMEGLMAQEVPLIGGIPFTSADFKLSENNLPVHILTALLPVLEG